MATTRLRDFAIANGYKITIEVKEIGSGFNDNRRKLMKLLTEDTDKFDVLIVEHKDRLTRFGFNYIDKWMNAVGKEVIVVNENNDEKTDLIQDFIANYLYLCNWLRGLHNTHFFG